MHPGVVVVGFLAITGMFSMRACMDSLIPVAVSFLVLQPQPPPAGLTRVLVLVKVMSSSGVAAGAAARALEAGGVMVLGGGGVGVEAVSSTDAKGQGGESGGSSLRKKGAALAALQQ
jgi:hypothetical protein